MNDYARLARAKKPEARTLAELLAACWNLTEEQANTHADTIGTDTDYANTVKRLPRAASTTARMVELLEELRHRKNPSDLVKDGRPLIHSAQDIMAQCAELRGKKKEYLLAFFLNARHQLISKEIISIGTLTCSLAHPREIFAPAIGQAAAGIILAHNHPSGDPSPSEEDIRLTKRIAQAGLILGIDLLDHLIIAENGCYSFKTSGDL